MKYDSTNIKVIEDTTIFDFVLIDKIVLEHSKPIEWVKRSFEACRLSGVDPRDYFIPRYILKDSSIPINLEVNIISTELQKALRV